MKIDDETGCESCQYLMMPASKKFMPPAQKKVFNLQDVFNATQNLWMYTDQPFCEEWS